MVLVVDQATTYRTMFFAVIMRSNIMFDKFCPFLEVHVTPLTIVMPRTIHIVGFQGIPSRKLLIAVIATMFVRR